jgi:hypothetical protein
MIRVKKGVVFKAFRPEMITLIDWLDLASYRIKTDIWITSGNDSKHRKDSYHYKDLAIDLRRWNLQVNCGNGCDISMTKPPNDMPQCNECPIFEVIVAMTGTRRQFELKNYQYYDFVLEKTHFHCEFDQRRYEKEKANE